MENPYREAADEIERTWRIRSSGIRLATRPAGIPIIPPIDEHLRRKVEDANHASSRRLRRIVKEAAIAVLFVAMAIGALLAITTWMP